MKTKILILILFQFFFLNIKSADVIKAENPVVDDILKKCYRLRVINYITEIYNFCKAKHDYYLELQKFRKNLKETKIKMASSTLSYEERKKICEETLQKEENHKKHLNKANEIEKKLYFEPPPNLENKYKLSEIIRDIDNLEDSPSLLDLINRF